MDINHKTSVVEGPCSDRSSDSASLRELGRSSHLIVMGYIHSEKCDLKEARLSFERALAAAKKEKNPFNVGEALVGLLRLAGEALDEEAISHWNAEIDQLAEKYPEKITTKVEYCRGVISMLRSEWLDAQKAFHQYLKRVRKEPDPFLGEELGYSEDYCLARALCMMANCLQQRGHHDRAQRLISLILKEFEKKKIKSINGIAYLVQGNLLERRGEYGRAFEWFQKAHASFLEEHNWYYYLYVLYGYARLARLQQNYRQAHFFVDLVEKAASQDEFGALREEIRRERNRLDDDVVDLLIDGKRGVVRTRESGPIQFRKQYVLLDILKALSKAHTAPIMDDEESSQLGGLSKGQLIEQVWGENYRPEVHDNKLYYNINRLRRMIEPNARRPQYLINWKEGYRLAPGLRVQFVDLDRRTLQQEYASGGSQSKGDAWSEGGPT